MENNIRKEFSLRIASKVFQFYYSFGGGAGKFLLRLHSEEDRLRQEKWCQGGLYTAGKNPL